LITKPVNAGNLTTKIRETIGKKTNLWRKY
jgi:hypothetical protein